jgi:hypothetical protein
MSGLGNGRAGDLGSVGSAVRERMHDPIGERGLPIGRSHG